MEGDKVHLIALGGGKLPPGVPSLRQAQEARTIRVREIFLSGAPRKNTATSKSVDPEKGKRRDWLPLLVREALGKHLFSHFCSRHQLCTDCCIVHLKYLTSTQTLDVTYEGAIRRFKVVSVSTSVEKEEESTDDLAQELQKLDINPSTSLWTVGWDTLVTIIDAEKSAADDTPTSQVSTGIFDSSILLS